jgi:D-sedoheptulose 7-phosphate isomerase
MHDDDAYQELADHLHLAERAAGLLPGLAKVTAQLIEVFDGAGRLLTFGNGGSATQAQHLAGELVGRYRRGRPPLAAMALTVDPAVVTCVGNDYGYDKVFARQIEALARPGDMVLAFSTSGRSANIVEGLRAARRQHSVSVLVGGGDGGPAVRHADHAILVPATSTARVQEMHLFLLHVLSERIDAWAAGR